VAINGTAIEDWNQKRTGEWIPGTWPATCSDIKPDAASLQSGDWWTPGASDVVALEEDTAKRLGVRIGSKIQFASTGAAPVKKIDAHVRAILRVGPLNRFWYRVVLPCAVFENAPDRFLSGGVRIPSDRIGAIHRDFERLAPRAAFVDIDELKAIAVQMGRE